MSKPIPDVGMFALVRTVAEDRFEAQPVKEAEAITELLQEFARRSGGLHDRALNWFQHTHPWLYQACREVPAELLATGIEHPEALAPAIERIAKRVDEHKSGTLWDDLGFSTIYEDLSRQLHPQPSWKFLQQIRGETRFALPASAWRAIIEGAEGRRVADDVEQLLAHLGVTSPDVRAENQFVLWSRNDELIHIRPQDAALVMDSLLLRKRGALLHTDQGWSFVTRDGDRNVFLMPVESYLGMRGIAKTVAKLEAERLGAEKKQLILEAARERLTKRGVEEPSAVLVERGGRDCIMMSPDDARVTLKPADPSEAYLATRRLEYDPRAKDYDPGVSILCVQAQKLSYSSRDEVRKFIKIWGLEDGELVDIRDTDAQMLIGYDIDRNAIILAPRGTESRDDILADANVFKVDASPLLGAGRVAQGFYEQFKSLVPTFDSKLAEYRTKLAEHRAAKGMPAEPPAIVIGGHSLGGSLTALLTVYLLNKGIPVQHAYTCGQPLTADDEFNQHAAKLVKKHGTVFVRYVNGDDPVPHVPMNCANAPLGFQIYIDEFGRLCPENKPLPSGATPPSDDIMSRIKRTVNNIREGANDHRIDTYLVLIGKAIRSFNCSVWD